MYISLNALVAHVQPRGCTMQRFTIFYAYLSDLAQPGASIAPQVSANHPRGDFAYLNFGARIFVEF